MDKKFKTTVNSQNKLTVEQKEEIVRLAIEGVRPIELIKQFKSNGIPQLLKRRGVKVEPRIWRKHNFNEHYFDSIDSEDKAYFLGLLYADGWNCHNVKKRVYSVGIELQIGDKDILDTFKKKIEFSSPLTIIKSKNPKNQDKVKLLLSSKKLSEKLISTGLIPRKSLTVKFPEIQKKLRNHFIRGYFDGDGSITFSYNKQHNRNMMFNLCVSRPFGEKISHIFEQEFNIKCFPRDIKDNKIKSINIGGNLQTIKILEWLYKDATIFLERKRDKFLNFLKEYNHATI